MFHNQNVRRFTDLKNSFYFSTFLAKCLPKTRETRKDIKVESPDESFFDCRPIKISFVLSFVPIRSTSSGHWLNPTFIYTIWWCPLGRKTGANTPVHRMRHPQSSCIHLYIYGHIWLSRSWNSTIDCRPCKYKSVEPRRRQVAPFSFPHRSTVLPIRTSTQKLVIWFPLTASHMHFAIPTTAAVPRAYSLYNSFAFLQLSPYDKCL